MIRRANSRGKDPDPAGKMKAKGERGSARQDG